MFLWGHNDVQGYFYRVFLSGLILCGIRLSSFFSSLLFPEDLWYLWLLPVVFFVLSRIIVVVYFGVLG